MGQLMWKVSYVKSESEFGKTECGTVQENISQFTCIPITFHLSVMTLT